MKILVVDLTQSIYICSHASGYFLLGKHLRNTISLYNRGIAYGRRVTFRTFNMPAIHRIQPRQS